MTQRSKQIEHATGRARNLEIPLTLTYDGRYFVKYKGKVLVEGTYTVSGDKIILIDERAERARAGWAPQQANINGTTSRKD